MTADQATALRRVLAEINEATWKAARIATKADHSLAKELREAAATSDRWFESLAPVLRPVPLEGFGDVARAV